MIINAALIRMAINAALVLTARNPLLAFLAMILTTLVVSAGRIAGIPSIITHSATGMPRQTERGKEELEKHHLRDVPDPGRTLREELKKHHVRDVSDPGHTMRVDPVPGHSPEDLEVDDYPCPASPSPRSFRDGTAKASHLRHCKGIASQVDWQQAVVDAGESAVYGRRPRCITADQHVHVQLHREPGETSRGQAWLGTNGKYEEKPLWQPPPAALQLDQSPLADHQHSCRQRQRMKSLCCFLAMDREQCRTTLLTQL